MKKILAMALVPALMIPTTAFAQQASEHGLGPSVLRVAVAEAIRLGRMSDGTSPAARDTQGQNDAWTQLPTLPLGTLIRLTLSDGSELEGQMVEARADAIVLRNSQLRKGHFRSVAGATLSDALIFPRANVSSVSVFRSGRFLELGQSDQPRHWPGRHPVLMGFLIGAGAGASLMISVRSSDNFACNAWPCAYGEYALLGVGIGGGIGALLGLAF